MKRNSQQSPNTYRYDNYPYKLPQSQHTSESYLYNKNGSKNYLFDNNSDFFLQEITPMNPYLPREQTVIVKSPQLSKKISGDKNEEKFHKNHNSINYTELNTSLNHQDQAKINRAIVMGWLPQKEAENLRNNKTKQQLYREELQKQIEEKQLDKMRQMEKQKQDDEKFERTLNSQYNLPQIKVQSSQPQLKLQIDKLQSRQTPSKLKRTPPLNSNRKSSIKTINVDENKDMRQKFMQKNSNSLNNISIPQSPQNILNKSFNKYPPHPPSGKKVMMVMVPQDFNISDREASFFQLNNNSESITQLSLQFMKKQMQESYLNAAKQLDELKIEMEKIKQSKAQAQQEFMQIRSEIKNQISFHNIKLYGGINFIKNPSRYYSMENQLGNSDSSILNPLISDTTTDQNLLQYSQTLSSSGQRLSQIQSPDLIKIQVKDNSQQADLSAMQTKEVLASKINTEQDIGKMEQILNDSQLSKISHQSIKSRRSTFQSRAEIQELPKEKVDEKATIISTIPSKNSLTKSDIQQNNDKTKEVEIEKINSVGSINSPLFDYKRSSESAQQQKQDQQQSSNKSNFFSTEVKIVQSKELGKRSSLDIHKEIIIDQQRRNSLIQNMNGSQQHNKRQGDQEFKTLIKNIEEMVEDQAKDIHQNSNQLKDSMKQKINFNKQKEKI